MKWLADENFDNDILRGISAARSCIRVVRAQDVAEISGLDDPAMLAWATTNDRIVLTHDLSTMIPGIEEQVRVRILLSDSSRTTPFRSVLVIEETLLLDECSVETDRAAGVIYLPLD